MVKNSGVHLNICHIFKLHSKVFHHGNKHLKLKDQSDLDAYCLQYRFFKVHKLIRENTVVVCLF